MDNTKFKYRLGQKVLYRNGEYRILMVSKIGYPYRLNKGNITLNTVLTTWGTDIDKKNMRIIKNYKGNDFGMWVDERELKPIKL